MERNVRWFVLCWIAVSSFLLLTRCADSPVCPTIDAEIVQTPEIVGVWERVSIETVRAEDGIYREAHTRRWNFERGGTYQFHRIKNESGEMVYWENGEYSVEFLEGRSGLFVRVFGSSQEQLVGYAYSIPLERVGEWLLIGNKLYYGR